LPPPRRYPPTIDQLRARYEQIVGRPTGSRDRRYLLWKIARAARGKVTAGPLASRKVGPRTAVTLRFDKEAARAMDAAWKRRKGASRMEFVRRAIHRELVAMGELVAAAMFAPPS
jgi:hypothetical protein